VEQKTMNKTVELTPLHTHAPLPDKKEPLTVALALVKNEGDIISLWFSHICEIFDQIYIVDHQSTDGTREFLVDSAKSDPKIHLYSFDHPGYYQSEITNYLANLAGHEYPNAWLFPIDADEFFEVGSQEDFRSLLKKQDTNKILLSNWRNCIPQYLYGDEKIDLNFSCFFPTKAGIFNKVAVHSSKLVKERLKFIQGNHAIENENGKRVINQDTPFLNLLHIPIRSVEHFALKCIQGYIAYNQLPLERISTGQGTHWTDMIDSVLVSGLFKADEIRKFVVSYGQPNVLEAVDIYKLVDLGWQGCPFIVPVKETGVPAVRRRFQFLDLAKQLLVEYPGYKNLHGFLRIVSDNQELVLTPSAWQKENKNDPVYKKLSGQSKSTADRTHQEFQDIDILDRFFSKAFTPRENRVPSTWEEHVPFLYCLLAFTMPRRFVELGSHYGNCFFAACQMSKQLNDSIECIAIDTWMGDPHSGKYQEDVFQQFSYILHRDYPAGRYIRKFFNDAANQFEDGSIDLLHIDGLHTYEAVMEDYQTWFTKLSDRGIIMFHDTRVKEKDFGVWRLWAEISTQYPSFEFEHGHGLGVLLVGRQAEPAVQKAFSLLSGQRYLKFARFFFSNIGKFHL
jgi:predicted O-methyltransferase YrrM